MGTKRQASEDVSRLPPVYLIDVDLGLGGGLQEGAVVELARQVQALVLAYHTFVLQVTLVADQDHRNVIRVLGGGGLRSTAGAWAHGEQMYYEHTNVRCFLTYTEIKANNATKDLFRAIGGGNGSKLCQCDRNHS